MTTTPAYAVLLPEEVLASFPCAHSCTSSLAVPVEGPGERGRR